LPELPDTRKAAEGQRLVGETQLAAAQALAALVFAEHGGDLTVAAPIDREAELDRVLADLLAELDGLRVVVGGELPAK